MKRINIFIFDVNSLVSAFLTRSHNNAKAFDRARLTGRIFSSDAINLELTDVFLRKKFDKYAPFKERENFLSLLETQLIRWPWPTPDIIACRDPKDDKYLELAVACNASCIITGDNDLLVLNPFQGILILSAADFLQSF